MTENEDYRLVLGKRADDLGLILTVVGQQYQLRPASSPPDHAEFSTEDLAEVEQFLARLEQQA